MIILVDDDRDAERTDACQLWLILIDYEEPATLFLMKKEDQRQRVPVPLYPSSLSDLRNDFRSRRELPTLPITHRQIRRQLAFLPVYIVMGYLWVSLILNFMTPGLVAKTGLLKGADFLHFYTIGSVVLSGDKAALYDMERQVQLSDQLVPEAKGVRYHPAWGPQVALIFAPFATMTFGWALAAWTIVTLIVYAICTRAIWRRTPALASDGMFVALLAVLSPALHNLVAYGQTSILAVVAFTLAYLALQAGRPLLAGAAIGLLAYKPQLGLVAAVVFVVARDWRVVAGALATGLGQLAIAWLVFGTATMAAYLRTLVGLPRLANAFEPFPHEAHSLYGFFRLLLPESAVSGAYVVAAIPVLLCAVLAWRSAVPLPLKFMALMLATVLVSPHLISYDLTITLVALLPLWGWLTEKPASAPMDNSPRLYRWAAISAYLVYFTPAVLISKVVYVQPTTVSMLSLLIVVTLLSRQFAGRTA